MSEENNTEAAEAAKEEAVAPVEATTEAPKEGSQNSQSKRKQERYHRYCARDSYFQ